MTQIGIRAQVLLGRGRQTLKRRVEISDAVLSEETDEIESQYWVFAFRTWEGGCVVCVERGLELGEVAVKGGDIVCPYTMKCANF